MLNYFMKMSLDYTEPNHSTYCVNSTPADDFNFFLNSIVHTLLHSISETF